MTSGLAAAVMRAGKWLAAALVTLTALSLAALLFAPTPTLTLMLKKTANIGFTASHSAFGLSPLQLKLENATLVEADTARPILKMSRGALEFSLWDYLLGADACWSLEGDDVEVFAYESAPESAPGSAPGTASEQEAGATGLDLKLPLAFRRVAVNNFVLHPPTGSDTALSIQLERAATRSDQPADKNPLRRVDVTFTLHRPSLDDYVVAGELRYRLGAEREIQLHLPRLDLNPLLGDPAPGDSSPAAAPPASNGGRDWTWLENFEALTVQVSVDKLLADTHEVDSLLARLLIGNGSIELKKLGGDYRWHTPERDLSQKLTASARFTPLTTVTQGPDARIELTLGGEDFTVRGEGQLNLDGPSDTIVSVQIDAPDLKNPGRWLNKDLSELQPFSLGATIALEGDRLHINKLKIDAGKSDLRGDIELSATTVSAQLHSEFLLLKPPPDLVKVATAEPQSAATAPSNSQAVTDQPRIFSDDPLSLDFLRQFHSDAVLQVDSVQLLNAPFTDFEVTLKTQGQQLVLKPSATSEEGGFAGTASVEVRDESALIELQFEMRDLNLEAFGLVPKDQLTGGTTNAQIALSSQGATSHQLAASVGGDILLTVTDAVVQSDSFELVGSDFIMEVLTKLNPVATADPTTALDCALVKFAATDGVFVSKNELVIETERVEIVAGGQIDLGAETLNINITPAPKGGAGLSVGSFVKFMKIGGPLNDPGVQVDAAGLLVSGLAAGAALSTGGLSIVADSLITQVANAGNACEQASQTD